MVETRMKILMRGRTQYINQDRLPMVTMIILKSLTIMDMDTEIEAIIEIDIIIGILNMMMAIVKVVINAIKIKIMAEMIKTAKKIIIIDIMEVNILVVRVVVNMIMELIVIMTLMGKMEKAGMMEKTNI